MGILAKLAIALRALNGTGVSSPYGPIAPTIKMGDLYRKHRRLVITKEGDATGGSTDANIAVQVTDHLGNDLDNAACQVLLKSRDVEFSPRDGDFNGTTSISSGSTKAGKKIAGGAGWMLGQTDDTGLLEMLITNSADETVFVSVEEAGVVRDVLGNDADSPGFGIVSVAGSCIDVTWSA